MNISNVKLRLTEEDILTIIEENLDIDGFKIQNIEIGELIKVKGYYKKGMKFNFEITLGLGSINDNVLKLRLFKVKLGVFTIWTSIAKIILKGILRNFENMGITLDKKLIYIDFKHLCTYINFVRFTVKYITLFKKSAEVYIEDLVYNDKKEALSLKELEDKLKQEEDIEAVTVEEEGYSKVRQDIVGKFPDEYKTIGEYLMLLPDITNLLYRLMKDKRVEKKTKILIGVAITYIALPLDVIPDSIPIVGKIDDFGIGFMLLDKIIDKLPEHIILQHWQGEDNIILKVKDIKNSLFDSIGRKNTLMLLNGCIVGLKKIIKKISSDK